MKKIVALATLLSVSGAYAQELKFGDLNYFLKEGQFNLTADWAHATTKSTTENGGATAGSRQLEGNVFQTAIGLGINDRLNLYLGLGYQYRMDVKEDGASRYTQDGLTTPALGANFRLLNQNDSAVNLDFGAVARIGFEDAVTGDAAGSQTKDGNAATRNSVEVNTRLGRKWNEANEWQVAGGAIYNLASDSEEKVIGGSSLDYDNDGSMDFFARAAYQYRPVNEFMIALAVQGTYVGSTESEETNSNTDRDFDSHLDLDFTFTAKYLITDNFIAKFNYNVGRNPDYDGDRAGTDLEIRNRRERAFGFGVDFLF